MAGSLRLYTRENHEGLQTYNMGSFSITNLEAGTDFEQNSLQRFTVNTLDREVIGIRLTVYAGGVQNLTVDKNYSPIPEYKVEVDSNYGIKPWLVPENCDLVHELLEEQPEDWELHWRDKYNGRPYGELPSGTYERAYDSAPLAPSSSFGSYFPPAFTANTVYEGNQGRWCFWTMNDIYFAVEQYWDAVYTDQGWRYLYKIYPAYLGPVNSSGGPTYTNAFRERGVSGPIINTTAMRNLMIAIDDTHQMGPSSPLIHWNFINFNYPIEDPTTHEIQEKQFIGFCIWRAGIDGVPTQAWISAFEKEFWEGAPEPPNDGPTSSPQGGRGTFSAPSDNRGDRSGATAEAISTSWDASVSAFGGGYNNYVLDPTDQNDLQGFTEMIQHLWTSTNWGIEGAFVNPMDSIISCHQIPETLAPPEVGNRRIYAATKELSTTTVPTFSRLITHHHVGSVDIQQYTDAFPDFTDTSIYIHLPYVGTVQIDTAACMHGWLAVDYLCDVSSGDCTALITTMDKFGNTEIRYEFKGDCSKTVPLQFRERLGTKAFSSVLPTLVGGAITLATGGIGGAVAGQVAQSAIGDVFNGEFPSANDAALVSKTAQALGMAKQVGSRSASIGSAVDSIAQSATAAALSGAGVVQSNASGGDITSPIDTACWILITRPQWSAPDFYARERAYPSDIAQTVGDFQGLLMVSTCELNGIDCTQDELHEIDNWLKAGVLLD